jgi:hypothetical protein
MNVTYYNDGTDSKGYYLESTVENEYGDVVSQKKVYYPLVKFESNQKLYFLQYNDKKELVYCPALICGLKHRSIHALSHEK